MARYRKKIKWKNLLSGALCLLLVVGAVMGITTLAAKDTTSIRSTAFSVGGINDDGNYVKTDTSIYTKDMFECQGLTIEPDFEATGTYQVFYYDQDKAFLGATEVMNAEDGVYTKGDSFVIAKYARIMITPAAPVAEEGDDEGFRIRFYEVSGYAKKYSISVNKEQNFDVIELNCAVFADGGYYGSSKTDFVEQENVGVTNFFDVDGYNRIFVRVPFAEVTKTVIVQFFDADGVALDMDRYFPENEGDAVQDGFWELFFDIPKDACEVSLVLCEGYEDLYEAYLIK